MEPGTGKLEFYRAASGVRPTALHNKYEALQYEASEEDEAAEPKVHQLGNVGALECTSLSQSPASTCHSSRPDCVTVSGPTSDTEVLRAEVAKARKEYESVQKAFEIDRKRAFRWNRNQSEALGKAYLDAYNKWDELKGALSWRDSAAARQAFTTSGLLPTCSGTCCGKSLKPNSVSLCQGFSGHL